MQVRHGEYQGWKNRQTWNVALWIRHTNSLYSKACDYANMRRAHGLSITYKGFIDYANLGNGRRTPDNISWSGTRLDYSALDQMLCDLVN